MTNNDDLVRMFYELKLFEKIFIILACLMPTAMILTLFAGKIWISLTCFVLAYVFPKIVVYRYNKRTTDPNKKITLTTSIFNIKV